MFEISHRRRIVSLTLGAAVAVALASTGCVAVQPYPSGPSYYAAAAPPRSAAHGYTHRYDDVVLVFDNSWNGYWVRSHPDHYFYSNTYYRRHGSGWQRARSMRGPWISVEMRALPPGLYRHATAKPRRADRRESALERRDTFLSAVKENREQRGEAMQQRRDEHVQAFQNARDEFRDAVKENRAERKEAVEQRRDGHVQAFQNARDEFRDSVKENRAERKEAVEQRRDAVEQRRDGQRQAVQKRVEERRQVVKRKADDRREIAESRKPRQTAKASAASAGGSARDRGQKPRKDEDEGHPESRGVR